MAGDATLRVEERAAALGYPALALLDADGKTARLYGTTGVPETFVVDTKGMIRQKVIGAADWSSPEAVRFLEQVMQEK